jgi:hypothetical protein
MYGATMGTLHLDVFADGQWTNSVWSMSGDQGAMWHAANINLNAWASDTVTFRWRGVTGSGSLSDMAVDAINIASSVGQGELQARRQFRVFPNPGTGEFNVVLPSITNSDFAYSVTDISGRVVLSGSAAAKSGGPPAKINLGTFAAGVYTLRVSCNGMVEYTKLYKI